MTESIFREAMSMGGVSFPRRVEIKPEFEVVVFGTWEDVIQVRELREQLLDQKPDDIDSFGDWGPYRIKCSTALEIADAVRLFALKNLDVAVGVRGKTGDGIAKFHAATSNGYGRDDGPMGCVEVDEDRITAETGKAIKEAIRVLRRVEVSE